MKKIPKEAKRERFSAKLITPFTFQEYHRQETGREIHVSRKQCDKYNIIPRQYLHALCKQHEPGRIPRSSTSSDRSRVLFTRPLLIEDYNPARRSGEISPIFPLSLSSSLPNPSPPSSIILSHFCGTGLIIFSASNFLVGSRWVHGRPRRSFSSDTCAPSMSKSPWHFRNRAPEGTSRRGTCYFAVHRALGKSAPDFRVSSSRI